MRVSDGTGAFTCLFSVTLTLLLIALVIYCRTMGWSMQNEWEMLWKEAVRGKVSLCLSTTPCSRMGGVEVELHFDLWLIQATV
jgi:hypothetical protein